MEILEKEKILSIQPTKDFSAKKILAQAGIALLLIWGIFTLLITFFSQPSQGLLPYFIAISLLLVVPMVFGLLMSQYRRNRTAFIDGNSGLLTLKVLWRSDRIAFDEIKEFRIRKYRYKRGLSLYRLEAVILNSKPLILVRDIPNQDALRTLAKKIGQLADKPVF